MHRLSSFVLLAVMCLADLSSAPALAAQDQDKAKDKYNKPDVQIDRSVLKDLQGYEPPPMFGASSSRKLPAQEDSLSRPPVTPLEVPVLTQPKAEDLLSHPVENTGVLTVPQELLPDATPSKKAELPVPTGKKSVSKKKDQPTKPAVKTASAPKQDAKKDPEKRIEKKAPEKIEKTEKTEKKVTIPAKKLVTETIKATPLKPASPKAAYKPKSSKTMPAVPAIDVESSKLDPFNLPKTPENESDDSEVAPELVTPTPSERLMDQALTSRMVPENDPAIKKAVSGVAEKIAPTESNLISLEFKPKLSELQADQKSLLDSDIVARLKKSDSSRLQIQAFATADKQEQSTARRLSLSRGLSVRSYLLEKGIAASRIDVRALGDNTLEPPIDRVDLIFVKAK
jgi:outer membrane protein OmpA-like peptidoglycan-associated protein